MLGGSDREVDENKGHFWPILRPPKFNNFQSFTLCVHTHTPHLDQNAIGVILGPIGATICVLF